MNATTMLDIKNFVTTDRFVNMREIQKSPKNTLTGVKIIMNGSKAKGIYMDINEREEYLEDIEMMKSPTYRQHIEASRASGKPIHADEVR
jgi:hypothetical protein